MAWIAITAPDLIDSGTSGLGVRQLGLGRMLATEHRVDILAPGDPGLPRGSARLVRDPHQQRDALANADFVLTTNGIPRRQLPRVRGRFIFDLYDPSLIESMTLASLAPATQQTLVTEQLWMLRYAMRFGAHLLCANDAQKNLYLGMLLGRQLHRRSLGFDQKELERRLLIVPSGVEEDPLPDRDRARRDLGFQPEDVILIWGGGVWDWLDPFTVVDAVSEASKRAPRLRLVFLGLRRRGLVDPNARRVDELAEYCRSTGLVGSVIRINDNWVDQEGRLLHLAASDAGIIGQHQHLESRFAFRTRLMDCLWAGIPVLSAGFDALTGEGVNEGWAVLSPTGDSAALAEHLVKFARDSAWRKRLAAAAVVGRSARAWSNMVKPLGDVLANSGNHLSEQRLNRRTSAILGMARSRLYGLRFPPGD